MASQPSAKAVRALVVEDDYFLATDHAKGLTDAGVEVIGPVGTVDEALEVLTRVPEINWAMLDINLRGKPVYAVADALIARGVPFAFATGVQTRLSPFDSSVVPAVTACPSLVSVPELTASIRKLRLTPSTSASSAAAASAE